MISTVKITNQLTEGVTRFRDLETGDFFVRSNFSADRLRVYKKVRGGNGYDTGCYRHYNSESLAVGLGGANVDDDEVVRRVNLEIVVRDCTG